MRRLFHILLVVLTVGATLGTGLDRAQAASESIEVEVRSIHAKKEAPDDGPAVDPDLESLKSKLQGTFGDYESFHQLAHSTFSLAEGSTHSVELANGDRAEFKFNGKSDNLLKLGVNVGDRASISLRLSSGSTFFQAGLEMDGGMLIVAVTVTESDEE